MNISCLNTSAAVQSWLAEHGHSNHDALGMQAAVARYLGATSETLRKHGKAPIVWQEAFDHYGANAAANGAAPTDPPVQLPADTIVELWWGAPYVACPPPPCSI